MLTKAQITASRQHRRRWVHVEAWTPEGEVFDPTKHGVYVGPLGARAAIAYEDEIQTRIDENGKVEDHAALFATIAAYTVQNEDGSLMFDRNDAVWLANEAIGTLLPIFQTAMELSGLAKNLSLEIPDDASKNSKAGGGSDSVSS